jgi:hypothetical protein
MLTEQLSQQQLYIRLTAKTLKLLRSVGTLAKTLKQPCYLSTLSNLAETRMDKGFHYVAHVSTLAEHLRTGKLQGTSSKFYQRGGQVRGKALVTRIVRGGRIGVVSMVNEVVVGEFQ